MCYTSDGIGDVDMFGDYGYSDMRPYGRRCSVFMLHVCPCFTRTSLHLSFVLLDPSLISPSSPSSADTVPTAAMLLFLKSYSSSILLQSHPHGHNHRPPCSATLPVSSTADHQCCACPNLPSKQQLSAGLLGHRIQLRPQALTFGVWMAVTHRISCWCVQINSGTLGSRFGQQTAMPALLRQAQRCCCNQMKSFFALA